MSARLPVLLSLPHGGLAVPPEVAARLAIDETVIYNECDLWVDELFDFAHPDLVSVVPGQTSTGVLGRVTMPIARVLIDANRPPDSLDDPDGAVKSHTSYGQAVYHTPLTRTEQEQLLARYWQPFHDTLDRMIDEYGHAVKLFLDCHNMAQVGPSAYGDAGQPRPFICLGNFGNSEGEARQDKPPLSCLPPLMRRARRLAEEFFGDLELLEPAGPRPAVAALNHPFPGGYILRHVHQRLRAVTGRDVPCIMIEVNRGLFVGNQTSTTPVRPMNPAVIGDLRRRLFAWTRALVETITAMPFSSLEDGPIPR